MMDLYFNPDYAKIYEDIEGKSDTFRFECEHGAIQNTFILRPVKWKVDGETYYDIATPYGYGGPVALECSNIEALMGAYREAFTKYCLDRNIVCEFVRFHLFDNRDVREHWYGETEALLDNVVVDTKGRFDDIWSNYDRKVRKNVNQAAKNGLHLLIERNPDHLDDFLRIYYKTMDRNGAKEYYYFSRKYFEDLARLLPENHIYFHAAKDGTIVSTEPCAVLGKVRLLIPGRHRRGVLFDET